MMRRFVDKERIRHLPVERLWCDQRGHMITEGTPEIGTGAPRAQRFRMKPKE
jgi:hypothetical protein